MLTQSKSVLMRRLRLEKCKMLKTTKNINFIWELDQVSVTSPIQNGLLPAPTIGSKFSNHFFLMWTPPCWRQTSWVSTWLVSDSSHLWQPLLPFTSELVRSPHHNHWRRAQENLSVEAFWRLNVGGGSRYHIHLLREKCGAGVAELE